MTIEKYIPMRLLRPLEVSLAALHAAIGSFIAFYAARDAFFYASDFLWRISKGYLSWGMQLSMGAYIISMVMLATVFYLSAYTLYKGRLSRSVRKALLWVSGVGIVAFLTFVGILFVGFSSMGDI